MRVRRPRGVVLAGALALTLLAGCGPRGFYRPIIPADTPAPVLVDERANGGTVDLERTQWLLVRLPVVSGSPLRWSPPDVGTARNVYPSGNTPRFETDDRGGLTEIFTFRAEAAGTARLAFAYRNPETPEQRPARSVAFDVVVH